MRWKGGRRSQNIEDRRGQSAPMRGASVPLTLLLPLLRSRFGWVIIGLGVLAYLMGYNPLTLLGGVPSGSSQGGQLAPPSGAGDSELADFVSVVLADTEDTWSALFAQQGRQYEEPTLVLFSSAVQSACGFAQSAMGPFYCPADKKIYIDLQFYKDLRDRHNAPGDFAQAYVIAHEVGHHVQTLMGISSQVRAQQKSASQTASNALQVKMELQADCFAGLWAHHANQARAIVEPGDIDEALNAASQIGDDTLQKQAQGYVVPESFTHGSSQQRQAWFRRGYELGSLAQCNTFAQAR